MLALIVYITGRPAPEPCTRCRSARAEGRSGPEGIIADHDKVEEHVKGVCVCGDYARKGWDCSLNAAFSKKLERYAVNGGSKALDEPVKEKQKTG